jgi:hypothetical protein
MANRILGLVLALGTAATWAFSPAVRTHVTALHDSYFGWTEAARQADPAGFTAHVEAKLKQDLVAMNRTRRDLAAEVGQLSKISREQSALAEQARRLAEEFRDEYQHAVGNGGFPIEVRGAAYTEGQVRSQVSLLLAESEGYEAALADLESVRVSSEEKLEELAVRINRTEAHLAALATKRELLRAREMTVAGQELLAQVDELMTGNRRVIDDNPVAPAREVLARTPMETRSRVADRRVEEFLESIVAENYMTEDDELVGTETSVPAPKARSTRQSNGRSSRSGKQRDIDREKPIFQQS